MFEDMGVVSPLSNGGAMRNTASSPPQFHGFPDAYPYSDGAGGAQPVGGTMGNFGDTLRQEREFRGITLDAITQVTKISNRHLVALEQEHFDMLPGGVFNKSMVREYARVVGLDQEEWVARYLSAHSLTGAAIDEDGWMRFVENASRSRESGRGRRDGHALRWMGIGVLLLLEAGLSWFVWGYVHRKISLSIHPAAQTTSARTAGAQVTTFRHSPLEFQSLPG
jgi:cytoskeleton protein RodZ